MTTYGTAADRVARAKAASLSRLRDFDTESIISTYSLQSQGSRHGSTSRKGGAHKIKGRGTLVGSVKNIWSSANSVDGLLIQDRPISDTSGQFFIRPPSTARATPDADLTYLGVHFDREDSYTYTPGETISGKIVMKTERRMYVSGLDFRLKGKVDVMLFNSKVSYRNSEAFLYHSHRMMGVWDRRATQLEPGTYVSEFRYVLPNSVPGSITKLTNCQIRVIYGIQAALTDMDGNTRQVNKRFIIQAVPHKINPNPAFYSDEYENTSLRFKLDNSNIIVGKPAVVAIESQLKFTEIRANLEQSMRAGPHHVKETLTRIKTRLDKTQAHENHVLRIHVPEHSMFDISKVCKIVEITQTLHVKVKHKYTWITFSVPVKIYPAASHYGNDIPKFERVLRYPTLDTQAMGTDQPVKVQVTFETESWLSRKFSSFFQ